MKKYNDLPKELKNQYVKKYYDILEKRKINLCLKRLYDIFFSILLLIVISPIILILAIVIKLDSKGPVFYRQERVTRYCKTFKIFKFRTMVVNADKIGGLLTVKNDNRITRVGKILRKFKLDEIPQLINVLKGEMSFVGVRPEVKKYVDTYTDEMKAVFLIPAGITSTASIKYKDEENILKEEIAQGKEMDEVYIKQIVPDKNKYDLEYLSEISVFNDFKICIKTLIKLFK